MRRAELNKRNFGYGVYYEPTYYRSRKREIMEALGENYDQACPSEDRFLVVKSFKEMEDLINEENDY